MDTIPLLTPMLDQGIRNTNFFNGRLLTAEDLQTFQTANKSQHNLLGRAIGDGVVSGLTVTLLNNGSDGASAPVVDISPGLAVNRRGAALVLPQEVQVQLALDNTRPPTDPSFFDDCAPNVATPPAAGGGASVLVIAPASGLEDQAPMRSLESCACTTGCGSKYAVEGVKFRLVPLPALPDDFPTNALLQRNYLAHLCFGTPTLAPFPADPLHAPAKYGVVDAMRDAATLTDCDVPLALIFWTQSGVQFVDPWAVRRRALPHLGEGADNPWPMHAGQRRLAEAEATFYQFQDHLADIFASLSDLSKVIATDHFRYLPAGGYVPLSVLRRRFDFGDFNFSNIAVSDTRLRSSLGIGFTTLATKGFNEGAFFSGLNTQDAPLDVAFIRHLIERSWYLEPIDLTAQPQTLIRVYKNGVQPPYLLFLRQETQPPAPPKPGTISVSLNFNSQDLVRLERTALTNILALFESAEVLATTIIEGKSAQLYKATFESFASNAAAANTSIVELPEVIAATYRFDLPAGTYSVLVTVTGFSVQAPGVSPQTGVIVTAGATTSVSFAMQVTST